jgi:hypothetical protein
MEATKKPRREDEALKEPGKGLFSSIKVYLALLASAASFAGQVVVFSTELVDLAQQPPCAGHWGALLVDDSAAKRTVAQADTIMAAATMFLIIICY